MLTVLANRFLSEIVLLREALQELVKIAKERESHAG